MNYFLFIFMITLTVATSNPFNDLSYGEIVDLVNNWYSIKEENINLRAILQQATTKNNALKSSYEQCVTGLQNTKADLKSSQQELASNKARITQLENKIQMPTPEPEPKLSDEERVDFCGVVAAAKDERITASSILRNTPRHYGTQHSRLNTATGYGGWFPNYPTYRPFKDEWIQLDMGIKRKVKGIATQGGYHFSGEYVETYSIAYKTSTSSSFQYIEDQSGATKIFQGNTDHDTVIVNDIDVEGRFIRIYPLSWNSRGAPVLRFDVLLC